jgi:hypothetical protein
MTLPTIHLNGTSAQALCDQADRVYDAAQALIEALAAAAPNGRDYYPQGPEATGLAITEHTARIAAVLQIQRDMQAVVQLAIERGAR